jgi:uncharacterized protein (TIGR03000 family)
MFRGFWWRCGTAALATLALCLGGNEAQAQRGGHGGWGGYHGGYYHGGYYYGPYHHYGYGPYYGFGIGIGFYGYPYGAYAPYYGVYGYAPPTVVVSPPDGYASPTPPSTTPQNPPQRDNAAHLQLMVPENAEVWVDGAPTKQTGTVREFTSPPLELGKSYTYMISVRYRGANGQPVNDTRPIHVRANDWFSIDFTRPAPPEQTPPPRKAPAIPLQT